MRTRFIALLLMVFTIHSFAVTHIYVKVNGTTTEGSGVSWEQPTTLDNALSLAQEEDVVHIAAGTYVPSVLLTGGSLDRDRCFEVRRNVSLIGGYPADAVAGSNADPKIHQTILSGQLDATNRAYHVVVITAPKSEGRKVSLTGLTIRDGLADVTTTVPVGSIAYGRDSGGGIISISTEVEIADCLITQNSARGNAGIWMKDVKLTMRNCEVRENNASVGQTGGVYLYLCNFLLDQIVIADNVAKGNAAGFYIYSSTGVMDHSVVSGNVSDGVAGGIQTLFGSKLYMYNTTVSGNKAKGASSNIGGIYHRNNSYLQMVNCTVSENEATINGGAIGLHDNAIADVINTTIVGNKSTTSKAGGAYINAGCKLNLYNSLLSNNGTEVGLATNVTEESVLVKKQSFIGTTLYGLDGTTTTPNALEFSQIGTLADNGGVNKTILLSGSVPTVPLPQLLSTLALIGAPADRVVRDQRSMLRKDDAILPGACDQGGVWSVDSRFRHFILYGQSLGAGYQSYPPLTTTPVAGSYMIGNQSWIHLNNRTDDQLAPLYSSVSNFNIDSKTALNKTGGATCESPLTAAVNHINLAMGDGTSYLATNCAISGQTIEQLSKESTYGYYENILKTLRSGQTIAQREGYSIACPAFFWMQGEYNYDSTRPGFNSSTTCSTDKESYKTNLLKMKESITQDVRAVYGQANDPWMITYLPAPAYMRGFDMAIHMAQLELANANDGVICAGPTYAYPYRDGHMGPNGYRWYGEMLAKAYCQSVKTGKKFIPLQPKSIRKTAGNELTIHYYVPVKPLVIDTKTLAQVDNYGFEVKDGDVQATISSVEVGADGESIVIRCAQPFASTIEISYAGANAGTDNFTRGRGNVRDSDPYQANYTYVELPADLRPSTAEPQDAEGVIYGKHYPLYNFSVNYYYSIGNGESEFIVPGMEQTPTAVDPMSREVAPIRINQPNKETIVVTASGEGVCKATLISFEGRTQWVRSFESELKVDLSGISNGAYLLYVQGKGERDCFKIIK